MAARTLSPAAVFAKALRSFETGGFTYGDFLAELEDLLSRGASPSELMEILRRREFIEPLPDYAHVEVLGLLNKAKERPPAKVAVPAVSESVNASAVAANAAVMTKSAPIVRTENAVAAVSASEQARRRVEGVPASVPARSPSPEVVPSKTGTVALALPESKGPVAARGPDPMTAATGLQMSPNRGPSEAAPRATNWARAPLTPVPTPASSTETVPFRAAKPAPTVDAPVQPPRAPVEASTAPPRVSSSTPVSTEALSVAKPPPAETVVARPTTPPAVAAPPIPASSETIPFRAAKPAPTVDAPVQPPRAPVEASSAPPRANSSTPVSTEALPIAKAPPAETVVARPATPPAETVVARPTTPAAVAAPPIPASSETIPFRAAKPAPTVDAPVQPPRAPVEASTAPPRTSSSTPVSTEALPVAKAPPAETVILRPATPPAETVVARPTTPPAVAAPPIPASSETVPFRAASPAPTVDAPVQRGPTKAWIRSLISPREPGPGPGSISVKNDGRLSAADQMTVPIPSRLTARLQAEQFTVALNPPEAPKPRAVPEPIIGDEAASIDERVPQEDAVSAAAVAQGEDLLGRDRLMEAIAEVGTIRRDPPRNSPAVGRVVTAVVVVLVLAGAAWFFTHRSPARLPASVSAPPVVPAAGIEIHDCPTCPGMTVLPTGRFKQGSARTDTGSSSFTRPQHWVIIGRPVAMSTNPVTVNEFGEFVAATGRDMQGCDTYDGGWKHRPNQSWKDPGFIQTDTHPVTCASWNDAEAYARWLSAKTGHRYRLPSASEWEYAARAGGAAAQPWNANGSGACEFANVADKSAGRRYPGWLVFACEDGFVNTSPVGSFKPNAFGLNDMLGNVFQWTQDCWNANYAGAPTDGSARTDGDCVERELRGGSWYSEPAFVRADYRNHFAADYRTSSVGIRLVRDFEQ